MKDSEKRKYAEELFPQIKEGRSFQELKSKIEGEVKGSYTVDSIMIFLKRQVIRAYDQSFKEAYGSSDRTQLRTDFNYLHDDVFNELYEEQRKDAFRVSQNQFNKLLKAGGSRNDAAKSVINDVYTIEHAKIDALRHDQRMQIEAASGPSYGRVAIGAVLALGGIVMSMNTNAIFYGAVFVGIGMIITGLMGGD